MFLYGMRLLLVVFLVLFFQAFGQGNNIDSEMEKTSNESKIAEITSILSRETYTMQDREDESS